MTATDTDKIILFIFTDPMMGLSYEHEPVLEKLKTHYGEKIIFHYVMAGLVRDVADFMTPAERALPPSEGIAKYNKRLAGIYLEEEPIGDLPMDMTHFHLFDPEHRSSWPLDIAYEAVRLIAPEKAENFLYALRRATIVEGRQTTKTSELVIIAEQCDIDAKAFLACFTDGRAEAAFQKDLMLLQSYDIYALPSYLVKHGKKELLINGLPDFNGFQALIQKVM